MQTFDTSPKRSGIVELREACPFKAISDTGVKVWESLNRNPFQGEDLLIAISRYMPEVAQSMGYSNEYRRVPGKVSDLQGLERDPSYSYPIEYHIDRVLKQAAKYEVDAEGKLRVPHTFLNELCKFYEKSENEIHRYILDAKRIADVLHDVGKPNHWHTGATQNIGTIKAFRSIQDDLPLDDKQKRLAFALMNDDSIGLYFQHEEKVREGTITPQEKRQLYNLNRAARAIIATATEAGIPPSIFLELKIPCYIHDASSYTRDAGEQVGTHSLDRVFLFETSQDLETDKLAFNHREGRPSLSATLEADLAKLKERVLRISIGQEPA